LYIADGRSGIAKEDSMEVIRRLWNKAEEGQDMIEYAVLAAFISIVAITVIRAIGPLVTAAYTAIQGALTPLP
jgi:Flp pilus assembly pilin Flp